MNYAVMSEASWLWRYKQNRVENRVFWKICVLPKKSRCANSFERDCKDLQQFTGADPGVILTHLLLHHDSGIDPRVSPGNASVRSFLVFIVRVLRRK